MNAGIQSTSKTHEVQTRFRIDEKKRVPYARTEHNLLEIMEGDAFLDRFSKYGIVKPYTKTARHMKRAYELLAEGKEIEPLVPEKKPTTSTPTSPSDASSSNDATTLSDGKPASPVDTVAAAAAASTANSDENPATPSSSDNGSTSTPPVEEDDKKYEPYRPRGDLPLSLRHNHVHLAVHSTTVNTGLIVSQSSSITSEIRSGVESLLEEHMDEAMLMFHRDVPNLKEKLCFEITEACKPTKRKTKNSSNMKKNEKKETNSNVNMDKKDEL